MCSYKFVYSSKCLKLTCTKNIGIGGNTGVRKHGFKAQIKWSGLVIQSDGYPQYHSWIKFEFFFFLPFAVVLFGSTCVDYFQNCKNTILIVWRRHARVNKDKSRLLARLQGHVMTWAMQLSSSHLLVPF